MVQKGFSSVLTTENYSAKVAFGLDETKQRRNCSTLVKCLYINMGRISITVSVFNERVYFLCQRVTSVVALYSIASMVIMRRDMEWVIMNNV